MNLFYALWGGGSVIMPVRASILSVDSPQISKSRRHAMCAGEPVRVEGDIVRYRYDDFALLNATKRTASPPYSVVAAWSMPTHMCEQRIATSLPTACIGSQVPESCSCHDVGDGVHFHWEVVSRSTQDTRHNGDDWVPVSGGWVGRSLVKLVRRINNSNATPNND